MLPFHLHFFSPAETQTSSLLLMKTYNSSPSHFDVCEMLTSLHPDNLLAIS